MDHHNGSVRRVAIGTPLQQSSHQSAHSAESSRTRPSGSSSAHPRQRYRVIQPVVSRGGVVLGNVHDARYRKPKKALGDGEILGKAVTQSGGTFTKTAAVLPSKTRKRVFFEDGDEETLANRVLQGHQSHSERSHKDMDNPPRLMSIRKMASSTRGFVSTPDGDMQHHDIGMVGENVEIGEAEEGTSSAMLIDKDDNDIDADIVEEVEEQDSGMCRLLPNGRRAVDEYEEVDIDGLEEDVEGGQDGGRLTPPQLDRMSAAGPSHHDMIHAHHHHGVHREQERNHLDHAGTSLRHGGTVGGYMNLPGMCKMRATNAAVKQLSGENSYLKDQLDASYYKIKQLESLLLDRNVRMKQLLTENLRMSARMKKLVAELGEDAAAEALEGMS